MAYINFVLPHSTDELLEESPDQYFVREVLGEADLKAKIKDAAQSMKEEGPEFVLEYFDTYFSVIQNADSLKSDLIFKAYKDLHYAVGDLNKNIGFILQDKSCLNEEFNLKYLNILKMLLYLYSSVVSLIESKDVEKKSQKLQQKLKKGKKKVEEMLFLESVDRKGVLLNLNYIMQREINIFWDPPIIEATFVNMVANVCYLYMENADMKRDKDLRTEVFNLLGTLMKTHNHGEVFVVRMAHLIKQHEHLVQCASEGIKVLVEEYNSRGLVREFVKECTEWQVDENYQDNQGAKNCSAVLCRMAEMMPNLMIPEMLYLEDYLSRDSYTLRNSILTVITELILTVLTKPDLSDEERESRDDFFAMLEEHLRDVSVHVRAKVVQHWARLHKENAVPVKVQIPVLEEIVLHLRDKGAFVRKNSASAVTSFLVHNDFGAQLQLATMNEELKVKTEELDALKAELEASSNNKLGEIEAEWETKEKDIRAVIEEKINEEIPASMAEMAKDDFFYVIRTYITEGKYAEAFAICKSIGRNLEEWNTLRDQVEEGQEVELYLTLMRTTFFAVQSRKDEMAEGAKNLEEDLKRLEVLESTVAFYQGAVSFLKILDGVYNPMAFLLQSASVGEMQVAVDFFVAAYKFNIDNSHAGLLEMLNIMKQPDQEKKNCIINAFKTIFLDTDSKTLQEHTQTIVNRLIELIRKVPFDKANDFRSIIANWIDKGTLDNSVIDTLWQYFTKKIEVSDDHSLAALQLLACAAEGRRTIIKKNIKLVTAIAFGERGANDLKVFAAACKLLSVAGSERPKLTDKNPPFKIKRTDGMWASLSDILVDHFFKPTPFYNQAISYGIECVYRLCAKPDFVAERIVHDIMQQVKQVTVDDTANLDCCVLLRLTHLLGELALNHMNYLDDTVYMELKRRNHWREERKNEKKKEKDKGKKVEKKYANPSTSFRNSSLSNKGNSKNTTNNSTNAVEQDEGDESCMEGALADDVEAAFIIDVMENQMVTGDKTLLGKLGKTVSEICRNYTYYDNEHLQSASVTSLLRYMLVSSKYCQQHIQLIFTLLEKSPYPDVRCTILLHLADLLDRFPSVIDPWSPRIYNRIDDVDVQVRKTAFFMLSSAILKDMLLVKQQVAIMTICLVDDVEELVHMSRQFFTNLSKRPNTIYNIIPVVFSHLCEVTDLSENNFKYIMKYLFDLIDKTKLIENLVERFCLKFQLARDVSVCKKIGYCLTLVPYNEKSLRRLLDNFALYKEHLLENEVYVIFKQILNTCNRSAKPEIKAVTAEIEEKINSVFDLDDSRRVGGSSAGPPRSAVKKQAKKKQRKPTVSSEGESDFDSDGSDQNRDPVQSRGTAKKKAQSAKKQPAKRQKGRKQPVRLDLSDTSARRPKRLCSNSNVTACDTSESD